MYSTCVLTDSSAQFPQPSFLGNHLVRVIPIDVEYEGQIYQEGKNFKINKLPPNASNSARPILHNPDPHHFQELFESLREVYDQILVILMSNRLSPIYDHATLSVVQKQYGSSVQIINSQTTSVGLGLLVQKAAALFDQGSSMSEVEKQIRKQIPHIYTLLCAPGLSYLFYAGLLDQAQAAIAEYLNMFPVFTLEDGRLSPLEKVRNQRAALDFFQEFINEFDDLDHIALLQGHPQMIQESRILKQFITEYSPQTPYSEHTINTTLASLIGPRCLGLVVAERPED